MGQAAHRSADGAEIPSGTLEGVSAPIDALSSWSRRVLGEGGAGRASVVRDLAGVVVSRALSPSKLSGHAPPDDGRAAGGDAGSGQAVQGGEGVLVEVLVGLVARDVSAGVELPSQREELRRHLQRRWWRVRALERMFACSKRAQQQLTAPDLSPLLRRRRLEVARQLHDLPGALVEMGRADFERVTPWVEDFEAGIAPTTLHFLLQSEALADARLIHFLLYRGIESAELLAALKVDLGGGNTTAAMLEFLGADYLRTRPPADLGGMTEHFERWRGVVRYYQDPKVRARVSPELAARAVKLYEDLTRRISKVWRTELRVVDPEDAVQETVTRLVGDGLKTYRYESDLLNYLVEVAKDYLRRQYHRPRTHDLLGDEPILDSRPTGFSWAHARDRLAQIRALAPELVARKFKRDNGPVALAIWEEVMRAAERELEGCIGDSFEDAPAREGRSTAARTEAPKGDEELAAEISRRYGRPMSVPNLRVIRSRLRTALGEALGLRPGVS